MFMRFITVLGRLEKKAENLYRAKYPSGKTFLLEMFTVSDVKQ